jgi:hypothetical protein
MRLEEFIADQKQMLDDFAHMYEERFKKGKERTKFHPEPEWKARLATFKERYDGQPEAPIHEQDGQQAA